MMVLAKYLAPEIISLNPSSHTPDLLAADIYSYGKLLRTIAVELKGVDHRERSELFELAFLCTSLVANERPPIEAVLSHLRREFPSGHWTEVRTRRLANSVVADIDARVFYGVSAGTMELLRETALRVATEVARDMSTNRMSGAHFFTADQMTHFIGSVTLFSDSLGSRFSIPDAIDIVDAMEYRYPPNQGDGATILSEALAGSAILDGEWRAEIERNASTDWVPGMRGSREAYVRSQIEVFEDVSRSVLMSNTFLTTAEVSALLDRRSPAITQEEVRVARQHGYVLGLPVGDRWLYPTFQFESDGRPRSAIKAVHDVTRSDRSAWSAAVWWFLAQPALNDESPADWLQSGGAPEAVVELVPPLVS